MRYLLDMAHSPGFEKLVSECKTRIREVTRQEVQKKLTQGNPFFLVDTREESEWAAGRLPKSIHIGKGVIERDIETKIPDKTAEIILYCGGGFRSALAAEALQKMGYTRVFSMEGGYRGWKELDYPLAT